MQQLLSACAHTYSNASPVLLLVLPQGVLKLRGLPYSTSVADIKDFFTGFSVIDHGIFITNGPDGRASGQSSTPPAAHPSRIHFRHRHQSCSHAASDPPSLPRHPNTGEAFVVLTSEHEALRARDALNKKSIQNRWVELIQVAKGDLYTATVASPIINHFSNCPVYANVAMTCVRLRNLPSDVKEEDLFRFFHGLNVRFNPPPTHGAASVSLPVGLLTCSRSLFPCRPCSACASLLLATTGDRPVHLP